MREFFGITHHGESQRVAVAWSFSFLHRASFIESNFVRENIFKVAHYPKVVSA